VAFGQVTITGSSLGSALTQILNCGDIVPGSEPSYEVCKLLYTFHPLGGKLVDKPIELAMAKPRVISIPAGPEDMLKEAFELEWARIGADNHIENVARLARIYGIASIGLITEGVDPGVPVDYNDLWKASITFNDFDPLNTAGSLVLDQNPLSPDFNHAKEIVVGGKKFHKTRSCVVMNEKPIYIQYTSSSFGFVGRSVFQRTLYPLKSMIQSMVTDDMVTLKAGVLVAKIKQPGSIINNVMATIFGQKRQVVKEAQNYNVISIDPEEAIESLNLQNLDGASKNARTNVLENIASGAGMPAKLLTQETFAEGFGEGTEDARAIAQWIEKFRATLRPLYDYFDGIVKRRAWNPEFYGNVQRAFPDDYGRVSHEVAFRDWDASFRANWRSLLEEPDSEKAKAEDVALKAAIAVVQILLPEIDQENKATVIGWLTDVINSMRVLLGAPLELDLEALASYEPPAAVGGAGGDEEPGAAPPFSARDSALGDGGKAAAIAALDRNPGIVTALREVKLIS
jgi:hypothetical protein